MAAMSQPRGHIPLHYQVRLDPVVVRVARWIEPAPAWLIALILMAVAMAPYTFAVWYRLPERMRWQPAWQAQSFLPYAALFLPESIRRLDWPRSLIMLALAGATFAITFTPPQNAFGYPLQFLCWEATLTGLAIWLVHGPRNRIALALILSISFALTTLLPTITVFAWRQIDLTVGGGTRTYVLSSYILRWLTLAPLVWWGVQFANGGNRQSLKRRSCIAAAALVCGIAWFTLFFGLLVYPLARYSLSTNWPVQRGFALWILQHRRDPKNDAAIWNAVETANWSKPADDLDASDVRRSCVQALVQHDQKWTADQLSQLLRRHPSAELASAAAPILCREHRYETAPELMRYALLHPFDNDGSDAKDALVAWNIPQAALAILSDEIAGNSIIFGTPLTPSTPFIDPNNRKKLVKLMGRDAGPSVADWLKLYDIIKLAGPTPLSDTQQAEMNQVISAVTSYWITKGRLARIGRLNSVALPDLDAPGSAEFAKAVEKYRKAGDVIANPSTKANGASGPT